MMDLTEEKGTSYHLSNPVIVEKFVKGYLSSLRVYMDDDAYKTKSMTLPKICSSAVTRFEKAIEKDQKEASIRKKENNMKNSDMHLSSSDLREIEEPSKY